MSHTNTTTNYGLPQFLSSDKPAWMADINVAFADIDSQMKTNADAASTAQTTADDAVLNGAPGYSNLSTYAVGDVVNYLGRVYKCDIAVTTPEAFDNAKWSYYRLSDASAQLDVIDAEIGSTDISAIGDGSITGAISSVNSNFSNLLVLEEVGSNGITINSLDTLSVDYTLSPIMDSYRVVAVTPRNLGDSRLSFRGWGADYINNTVRVRIANSSASTANCDLQLLVLLVKESFVDDNVFPN